MHTIHGNRTMQVYVQCNTARNAPYINPTCARTHVWLSIRQYKQTCNKPTSRIAQSHAHTFKMFMTSKRDCFRFVALAGHASWQRDRDRCRANHMFEIHSDIYHVAWACTILGQRPSLLRAQPPSTLAARPFNVCVLFTNKSTSELASGMQRQARLTHMHGPRRRDGVRMRAIPALAVSFSPIDRVERESWTVPA